MARLNTFFLEPERWAAPFSLEGGQAHHLVRVLRAKQGEQVRLIDGQGRSGLFELAELSKKQAKLSLLQEFFTPAPPARPTIAVGWGKSTRRPWLLEKAVELEAESIIFWQAARSQGKIPDEVKESWIQKTIEAAKQCGNVWLPTIRLVKGVDELIHDSSAYGARILLWEKAGAEQLLTPDGERTLIVLGPEGGFDDVEPNKLIENGFVQASLGDSILRWETAAIHSLSLYFHNRQEQKIRR